MQRLHRDDRCHPGISAPGQEVADRPCVGPPGMRVADRGRKELEEANTSTLTGSSDQGGQRLAVERGKRAVAARWGGNAHASGRQSEADEKRVDRAHDVVSACCK